MLLPKKSTRPVPFLLYMKPVKVLSCANSILNQSLINQAQFGIIQPNSEPSDVPYSTNKKLVEYFILEARCNGWTLVFVEDRNKCLDFFKITVFTLWKKYNCKAYVTLIGSKKGIACILNFVKITYWAWNIYHITLLF